MRSPHLTRRVALAGAVSVLGGCSAISALNTSAQPLATYDLAPAPGGTAGRRTNRTLLVERPEASAAIDTERIMIKPNRVSVVYLPDARWSDELPVVVQSLLVRSISATGRIGYVGRSDASPLPDSVLLVRIDAFQVNVLAEDNFQVDVNMALTVIDDRDQRVVATRSFAQKVRVADDNAPLLVVGFQTVLNNLLPAMADWVAQRA